MEKIVIVGFGGHARSVADSIIRQGKYEIVGYTDTDDKNNEYKYLGNDIVLDKLLSSGIQNIVIGIGYLGHTDVREKIYKKMRKENLFQKSRKIKAFFDNGLGICLVKDLYMDRPAAKVSNYFLNFVKDYKLAAQSLIELKNFMK